MLTDLKLDYVPLATARRLPGLRLVLGAYAIPTPWREACKALFHVKGLAWTPVAAASAGRSDLEFGLADSDSELRAWTLQSEVPVAVWNDEKPCVTWLEQLQLAERLAPTPSLLPAAFEARVECLGLSHALCGEQGLGALKRLGIIHRRLPELPPGHPARVFWQHLAERFGYSVEAGRSAPARMAEILHGLDSRLARQQAAGSRYLCGDTLSAVDLYWACFAGFFAPLEPGLCPMATSFRELYDNPDPEVEDALSPALLAHRDFIYREHLELPVVF